MELTLKRKTFTDNSTIGDLFINGKFFCYVLEDKERGLVASEGAEACAKKKIYGKTAIPYGRYEVVMTYSNRFKQYMPLLLDVPAFAGIRIHTGNKAEDTEGCLLVGENASTDWVGLSRAAYDKLLKKFKSVEKAEKIFIEITNA